MGDLATIGRRAAVVKLGRLELTVMEVTKWLKRPGVAERFVVPLKPGNAGGGKGPQFKTDAISGEGPEDWATLQLRECS